MIEKATAYYRKLKKQGKERILVDCISDFDVFLTKKGIDLTKEITLFGLSNPKYGSFLLEAKKIIKSYDLTEECKDIIGEQDGI